MATKTPAAPKAPRRQPPQVLAGDPSGGVAQVVITQLAILGLIFFTYIGLWMVLDDSARLPGQKIKAAPQPTMPIGYVHEIEPVPALQKVNADQAKLISEYGVVDAGKGVYRMPIEQAMQLTAQRGWQVNASAFGKRSQGPTESGR